MVVDASRVNVIHSTALEKIEQLIDGSQPGCIVSAVARRRYTVKRLFEEFWVNVHMELADENNNPTLTPAVHSTHAANRTPRAKCAQCR